MTRLLFNCRRSDIVEALRCAAWEAGADDPGGAVTAACDYLGDPRLFAACCRVEMSLFPSSMNNPGRAARLAECAQMVEDEEFP